MKVPPFLDLGLPGLMDAVFPSTTTDEDGKVFGNPIKGVPWGVMVLVDGLPGVGRSSFAEHVALQASQFTRVTWFSTVDQRSPHPQVDSVHLRDMEMVAQTILQLPKTHRLIVWDDIQFGTTNHGGLAPIARSLTTIMPQLTNFLQKEKRILLVTQCIKENLDLMPKALKFYPHLRLRMRRDAGSTYVKVVKNTLAPSQGVSALIDLAELSLFKSVKPPRSRTRFNREEII